MEKFIALPRRHSDDKCINVTPDNHITQRPLAASSAPGTNNTHRTTSRRRVRDAGRQRQTLWNPTERHHPTITITDARDTATSSVSDVTPARRQQTTSVSSSDQPRSSQLLTVGSRSPSCWSTCRRQNPDKSSATALRRDDDVSMMSNDVTNIADLSRFVSSSLSVMTSMDECMTSSDDLSSVSVNQVI